MRRNLTRFVVPGVVLLLPLMSACSHDSVPEAGAPESAAVATSPARDDTQADVARVVFLGDSLAAGLGLPEDDAFPAIVEYLLRKSGVAVRVINAGVSGDTTAGGLSRLDWVLGGEPDVVVVELGGNDGLRGLPLEMTERNLRKIVSRASATGATVILLGMDVPTSHGPDYSGAFAGIYPTVAGDAGIVLVPGFLHGVGGVPELNQSDGLHPNTRGHRALADKLVPYLRKALDRAPE